MAAPPSPPFDEDDLGPGERWSDDKVLGKGQHADVQLQLAMLQVRSLFASGQLVLKPADRKAPPWSCFADVPASRLARPSLSLASSAYNFIYR